MFCALSTQSVDPQAVNKVEHRLSVTNHMSGGADTFVSVTLGAKCTRRGDDGYEAKLDLLERREGLILLEALT